MESVIGGPAPPQTPLLSWGALPPRPPALMFDEIEGGGLRGEAPQLSRGDWGAAGLPMTDSTE